MRDRKLEHLAPVFQPIVYHFLAMLIEAGIMIMIVETLRSEEQHQADIITGHSWIKRSKHQDGLAIDICPYEIYLLNGSDKLQWNADDSVWQRIGQIGESLGLVWGGRWTVRDMGHFEYKG